MKKTTFIFFYYRTQFILSVQQLIDQLPLKDMMDNGGDVQL